MTFRKSILLLISLCMSAALVAYGSSGTKAITVSVSPKKASVQVGKTKKITATTNDTAGVKWTATCGTISPTSSKTGVAVTYTAPAAVPSHHPTCTIKATSVTNTSVSAKATFTITAPITVSVSPKTANVQVNATQKITATTNDTAGVKWTATCGTISPTSSKTGVAVTYTAPAAVPTHSTCTITATSVTNTSKTATATFTITAPITVSVSPKTANVQVNATQKITATTNDTAGVKWTATCGMISPTSSKTGVAVTYTAPAAVPIPPTCTIKATSVTNTSITDTATFTITAAPITVLVSPKTAAVYVGTTQSITATTNDPLGVTWTATCGTVAPPSSLSGVAVTYTAPATAPSPPICTIKAASVTNTSITAKATFTITSGSDLLTPGNYVYQLSGSDENDSVFYAAGVFTVASDGVTITAGEQDFGDYDYISKPPDQLTGSVALNTDGTGTLLITLNTGDDCLGLGETDDLYGGCTIGSGTGSGIETLVAMQVSSSQLAISEYDGWATANGTMQFQDSSAIAATPSGGYAFYMAGIDADYYTLALGGVINVDGSGTISGAGSIFDANDGGTLYPAEKLAASTVTAPDSFGRVEFTLNATNSTKFPMIGLAGYIVNANLMQLVENDKKFWGNTGGTALTQNPADVGNFSSADVSGNSYVFGPSGAAADSGYDDVGVTQLAGLLTAGASSFSGVIDYNDLSGTVPPADTVSGAKYSVDPTGDVTITGLADNAKKLDMNLQFYLDGNGNALVISMDTTDATEAVAIQQSNVGSFTAGNFTGNYVLNMNGADDMNEMEIGAVGMVTADGVGTLSSGSADLF